MLIDTHTHWADPRVSPFRQAWSEELKMLDLGPLVICATKPSDWGVASQLARTYAFPYMLGFHPFFADEVTRETEQRLFGLIQEAVKDPFFIGIGEIGLDALIGKPTLEEQLPIFETQLALAQSLNLSVSVHIRKTGSELLSLFKKYNITQGVVHAYSGSDQWRDAIVKQGLKVGFGSMLTQEASRNIRRHARDVSLTGWVLETDSPDMAPAWRKAQGEMTHPSDIAAVAQAMAEIRAMALEDVYRQHHENTLSAFPRLADYLEHIAK